MKNLSRTILVLMSLFLLAGISYAQSAKEYYDKGIEYGIEGKFEEAKKEFKKVPKTDQLYRPAIICLQLTELALGNKIENEVIVHLFRGTDFSNKGKLDEAVAEFKKAVSINPSLIEAYLNLGIVYVRKGMLDEAIAEWKKAVAINPNLTDAHLNLGVAYHSKGMVDDAITEYKKALSINPNFAEANYNLGIAYGSKGMLDEEIAEYKKAISINPNFADAYHNLAMAYLTKKQYDLAIKCCDRAIKLGLEVDPVLLVTLNLYREQRLKK